MNDVAFTILVSGLLLLSLVPLVAYHLQLRAITRRDRMDLERVLAAEAEAERLYEAALDEDRAAWIYAEENS